MRWAANRALLACYPLQRLTSGLPDLAHDVPNIARNEARGRLDLAQRSGKELVGVLVIGLLLHAAQLQAVQLARREEELRLDSGCQVCELKRELENDLAWEALPDDGDVARCAAIPGRVEALRGVAWGTQAATQRPSSE